MSRPETFRHDVVVENADSGSRLDAFLAARLKEEGLSREKIKELIREGRVRLNNAPCTSPKTAVHSGDLVDLEREAESSRLEPEAGDLTVLYRDEYLAVLDKPAGLTVHPCPNRPSGTLAHRLVAHFPELAAMEGFRPGIVHRLDKDTSGLLVAALSEKSRLALAALFAEHEMFKEYLALVRGVPSANEERIETFMGRDPRNKVKMAVLPAGRPAQSLRRTLYADPAKYFSVQAVRILTGRTHQIRVHMASIGHPILGDILYGGDAKDAPRQMLHAHRLAFRHPFTEREMRFTCPPPEDFLECLRRVTATPLRVVLTGSPGSGKSTLLRFLGELGLPVVGADSLVADLYKPSNAGHLALRSHFGRRFVPDPHGAVDKKVLAEAMREDPRIRREVEALIHPLVHREVEEFWAKHRDAPAAVAEIPLYFEAGYHKAADPPLTVGVDRPFTLRRKLLIRRKGWDESLADAVESWQWPEAEKLRACDLVVGNTGSPEDLKAAAAHLAAELKKRAEQGNAARLEEIRRIWEARATPPLA